MDKLEGKQNIRQNLLGRTSQKRRTEIIFTNNNITKQNMISARLFTRSWLLALLTLDYAKLGGIV